MPEFDFDKEIQDIKDLIEILLGDVMIPKNVKIILQNIGNIIQKDSKNVVKLSEAIYGLQDISEDPNLPLNAKSDVWQLLNKLEKIKENLK
jgi:uncharacterized protein (UPF0147 family)